MEKEQTKNQQENQKKSQKLQWHPAFCSALRLELLEDAENLEFTDEFQLTEKPLQLMRNIVKITEPGGHILDPFAGSGTTVLAAVLEGYSATGIEVTDTYAKLARERICSELEEAA